MRRRTWLAGLAAACLPATARTAPLRLDRAVARYVAPEIGGPASPRFVYERELAFEARLLALADPDRDQRDPRPYRARHVGEALERHVAESILATLTVDPPLDAGSLARLTALSRGILEQRAGGGEKLAAALLAEGLDEGALLRVVRRQARAGAWLDRMVAPMLAPSDAELASIHRTQPTPFRGRPFRDVAPALRRWYLGRALGDAVTAWYRASRARVRITIL